MATWEVTYKHSESGYKWYQVYMGGSLIKAILAMRKSKRHGSGCIQLNWRPKPNRGGE